MKDEIKFDHFKNLEELKQNVENWLATDEMYWERWFGLYDIKTLLDYITNLQEKNRQTKLLKERYQLEKEDYKSRNEKAIEYINKHKQISEYHLEEVLSENSINSLLNILGGDGNE